MDDIFNSENGAEWLGLLALFALMAEPPKFPEPQPCCVNLGDALCDRVIIDELMIRQMRSAVMNKKANEEYEKMITKEAMDTGHSIDSLREEYEKKLEDESGYSGLFHFGDD